MITRKKKRTTPSRKKASRPPRRKQNPRFELRVHADSKRIRRHRRRKQMNALAIVSGLMVLSGLSIFVGRQVWQGLTFENQDFHIRSITVQTDGVLPEDHLLNLAGLTAGENIFRIDLDHAVENLLAQPFVRTARVERHLPDRLGIVVEERDPVAWLSCPGMGIRPGEEGNSWLIASDGVPLSCEHLVPEYEWLPVIHTWHLNTLPLGEAIPDKSIKSALEVVERWKLQEARGHAPLREVRINNSWSLRAICEDEVEVTFAVRDLDRQFRDLNEVHRVLEEKGEQLQSVNLVMKKNIAARTVPLDSSSQEDPSSAPPAAPQDPGQDAANDIRERQLRAILGNS